jgi:hypothetical protein
MWLYPWDAHDEGVPTVVDAIGGRAGVDGVALAVAYHSGMFLLPHNPRRKLLFPKPSVYFTPDPARYAGLAIQPIVNDLAASGIVETVRAETAARGMRLAAWVVCLHNTGIGATHPAACNVNAFGDRHLPHLCPASPDVRAYVRALFGDLADRGFDSIVVESLEYMPFGHGFHHEVVGLPLTPYASHLLGLCFCEHCLAAARVDGVDGEEVRRFVREELETVFAGDDDGGRNGIGWPEIRALVGGEMGAFHDTRRRVVTSLFAEVREVWPARGGPALELCDFAPLWPLGWDGTMPPSGLDLAAVAPYVDAAFPCPYFTDPAKVVAAMTEYRAKAPQEWAVRPIVRAISPQVESRDALLAQMLACPPETTDGYGFYNYGFMRLPTLDWIRDGLAAARERSS